MKTTTNLLSILSILLPSISAQIVNGNYVGFGTNSSAPDDGYATFKAADRMPNETHEVMFNRDNTITSGKNWTWTLKISNVAMPNDTGFDIGAQRSVDYPNAHVAFTTYDFGWPQGGNLNQAVAKGENLNSAITNTYPSCMYLIWAMWPANVSEKYDSSSSDCTSALGQDCVNKLLGGMQGGAECESNNFPSYLANEDSCQDSFGAIEGGGWAVLGVRKSYLNGLLLAPDLDLLTLRSPSFRECQRSCEPDVDSERWHVCLDAELSILWGQ